MSDKTSLNPVIVRWEQAIKLMPKTVMGVRGQLNLTPTPESEYGNRDYFYRYGSGTNPELRIFLYLGGKVSVDLKTLTENPMSIIEFGLDAKLISSLWAQAYASLPKDD